jgi:peptide deformylase
MWQRKVLNMKILTVPNKILTTKAEDVKDFSGMAELTQAMIQTALEDGGLIGLAANQVGILQRVFVMDIGQDNTETPEFRVFINPKTKVNQAKGKIWGWEGCGSIPGIECLVERWKEITITAQDVNGEEFTMNLSGRLARVALHEIDHLSGILITSKARQRRVK